MATLPKQIVHEYRMTANFNVAKFYEALNLPSATAIAKKLGVPDPQRVWYWKAENRMPMAVYHAMVEAFGTDASGKPIPHTKPQTTRVRQPVRLPTSFARFVDDKSHAAGVPSKAPVVRATLTQGGAPVELKHDGGTIRLEGNATLTIRIEVVNK